jgi:drug/metabolite transporter (DMT)-like permease
MADRLRLTALLVAMGAGWGLSVPLGKLAVSTGHQPFGLIFWEQVIVAAVLGAVCLMRGQRLVLGRATFGRYLMVAALGTVIPGWAYYFSAQHLPGGVLAILLSTVPMLAFPVALALGNEVFRLVRLGGLGCGMAGIVLLIGPEASLPDPAMAAFIPVALIAPFCYACEGNALARWGTAGLDPIQLITGASLVGMVVMLPVAVLSGQWIDPLAGWGVAEGALVLSALAHAVVYSGYVWMVGRAGSVFAAQVSYLVTGFGVLWSIALLAEVYSGYVWAALGLMVLGLALVQPRPRLPSDPTPSTP